MSERTGIEWTDATWNPVRGCVKVSPGCANCYAETFAERWRGVPGHGYEQGFDLRLVPAKLTEPFRWRAPRRVFVNSMSDLFQGGVPVEYIDRVFAVMALAPRHTFQVLTKRADRMREYLVDEEAFERVSELVMSYQYAGNFDDVVEFDARDAHENMSGFWPLKNVWLGVSVENQHFADERIPLLLQTPAAVRFISAEPLLGPVDLSGGSDPCRTWLRSGVGSIRGLLTDKWQPPLNWVIVGGESGHGARPFDITWARSIVAQCKAAGVPAFVKQLGSVPVMDETEWRALERMTLLNHVNHKRAPAGTVPLKFFTAKAGDPAEWPEDLRVREFPPVTTC